MTCIMKKKRTEGFIRIYQQSSQSIYLHSTSSWGGEDGDGGGRGGGGVGSGQVIKSHHWGTNI